MRRSTLYSTLACDHQYITNACAPSFSASATFALGPSTSSQRICGCLWTSAMTHCLVFTWTCLCKSSSSSFPGKSCSRNFLRSGNTFHTLFRFLLETQCFLNIFLSSKASSNLFKSSFFNPSAAVILIVVSAIQVVGASSEQTSFSNCPHASCVLEIKSSRSGPSATLIFIIIESGILHLFIEIGKEPGLYCSAFKRKIASKIASQPGVFRNNSNCSRFICRTIFSTSFEFQLRASATAAMTGISLFASMQSMPRCPASPAKMFAEFCTRMRHTSGWPYSTATFMVAWTVAVPSFKSFCCILACFSRSS
mmetsp:Transcript_144014/g.276384  ORF Transcript_144014/g.276384 Transcript_144014/m.276384 type:complete len:309 (+) Transcript_144014:20-946(+)